MHLSLRLLFLALVLLCPVLASAHEVYVLPSAEINQAIATPAFNMFAALQANVHQFLFWGFITILTIFVVFFVSISRFLEKKFDPLFARLRRYAAPIARVTIGISFLAGAYYHASYGPEIPLTTTFGMYAWIATALLYLIGILIMLGVYTRIAATIALGFFTIAVWYHGLYMLTYISYLGEILVLLILGSHHGAHARIGAPRLAKRFAPYSFLVLRICFGVSLLYASVYAKVLHNNLALMVAEFPLAGHSSSIAHALGFEPHFLVLGAAIIEILIGLFFILGVEIRFTALFVLFWLSMSLWWFGEAVWPHLILIGIPIAFICYGYDKYSLEGWLFKKGAREPVL